MRSRIMHLAVGVAAVFTVAVPLEVTAASPAPNTSVESVQPRALAGAPQSVATTPLDRAVRVRWRPPSNTGGEAVTGYRVQRRTPSGWRTVADVGASKRRTTVDGLVNGRTYRFRVAARNASGVGAFSTPVTVTLPVVRDIRAGFFHTCALMVERTVTCWGDNQNGQLGQGDTDDHTGPVRVPGLTDVRRLASGEKQVCAVRGNGDVWCWGGNDFGQVGNGEESTDALSPVRVPIDDVIDVAAGQIHTCALKADRTVWCWGANNQGQIGSGADSGNQLAPVEVADVTNVRSLALGHFFSCAVLMDRTMTCWGPNSDGQLGDGTTTSRPEPAPVLGVTDVKSASAGQNFVCAVYRDDEIDCWGGNSEGQVGDGTQTGPRLTATAVSTLSDVAHVSAGRNHACALRTTSTLRCWGDNTFGEIGDGTNDVRPTRVALDLGGPVSFVRSGNDHTCAALRDARVMCWGFNAFGQLGDGSTTDSNVPVEVEGL